MSWWRNTSQAIKLNAIVIAAFVMLLLGVVTLLSRSAGDLTRDTGTKRAAEEAFVMQTRLTETEQRLISDVQLLATVPNLIDAVQNGDERARARAAINRSTINLDLDDLDIVDVNGNALADTAIDSMPVQGDKSRLLSLALLGISTTDLVITEADGGLEIALVAVAPVRTGDWCDNCGCNADWPDDRC